MSFYKIGGVGGGGNNIKVYPRSKIAKIHIQFDTPRIRLLHFIENLNEMAKKRLKFNCIVI